MSARQPIVAVCGASKPTNADASAAEEAGRLLAPWTQAGAIEFTRR
jgi:hypothetical protein